MNDSNQPRADRAAGFTLLIAALLTIFAMAHHPTGHGGPLVYWVHGTMLVLLSALFTGFCHYSRRRGLEHLPVLAGLVAYGLGFLANAIAGTTNGFIVPALAAHGDEVPHALFILAWESNQAFARLGVAATGVAFAFWGADLLRRERGVSRLIGGFGVAAGVLPLALLARHAAMDVPTAFVAYSTHSAFVAMLAIRMIQRTLP